MQCAKCGGQNPDDAYFCGTCGVQLRSSFTASGPVEINTPGAAGLLPGEDLTNALDSEAGAVAPHANPFTEAEPTARRAFEQSFGEPPAAPMPPFGPALTPPASPPPPIGQAGPPVSYAPPQPPGYVPGNYAPPPGYAPHGYQQGIPPDGNTSGMGDGYPVPPEASGWTFAGFVPFGLFSFLNGNSNMGILGAVGSVIGIVGLVYAIMVGINGKESAWRNRRFNSIEEYTGTMRAWNNGGLILVGLGCAGILLYFIFVFVIVGLAASGKLD
jgi:hypothetical protein